ncbi:ankyrin repeats (3 copies) domain-containing protein [Ditylenchus destructor]|uniref:Ankyrin repeats (3 copies) domain-containing protein n=1 Tax=Ditylenchus destructor TaxID=166010 RepID=A0AAD4N712_9BILA|nr:ankyrin repeats (3 copies) domain-containing protein [Ditylenchus destructor]
MNHLDLLRNEHLQLQAKNAELQRRIDVLEAENALRTAGQAGDGEGYVMTEGDNFVKRLLDTVVHLYNKDLYSDITIFVDGHQLRGHRFVLAARTDYWGDLSETDRIDFEGINYSVAQVLLKYMYTDTLDDNLGDIYILDLLSAGIQFKIATLKNRCESLLIGRLEVTNCLKVYQFAESQGVDRLREYCAEFVASKWKDFKPEHFKDMAAPLLYKILKRRSKHVLHSIISLEREDVLFLYLIENDSELGVRLNEYDDNGKLPLELALNTDRLDISKTLVDHGADVNTILPSGVSFLWKAIQEGKISVCDFLIENGADVNYTNEKTGDTLLHILAKTVLESDAIAQWANKHIEQFEVNSLDSNGRTPLIDAVDTGNEKIFNLLVNQSSIDINIKAFDQKTALEIALLDRGNLDMAEKLADTKKKVELNVSDSNAQTLYHKAVKASNFAAIQFLAIRGADVNRTDSNGSTPLHLFLNALPPHGEISPTQMDILKVLLKSGADPTLKETSSGLSFTISQVYFTILGSTPIHFAVGRGRGVLKLLLESYSSDKDLPLSVLDKEGRSPLWCALLAGNFDSAKMLLDAGADVNEKSNGPNNEQQPLLIRAIEAKRDDIARFLLDNKAIAAVTNSEGFTCLNLAVEHGLTPTVDYLCKLGANLNHPNPQTKLVPLWTALQNSDYGTAEVLVGHGCDTEGWAPSSESSLEEETLLHRAIDQCNQKAAIFLIKSGCNVNALRRLRDPMELAAATAKSGEKASHTTDNFPNLLQTPLHSCVQWGLTDVAKALISNLNCKIDSVDSDGRTPCHVAVMEKDQVTLELLLSHPDTSALSVRDRYGQTPLALAMKNRYNHAAEAICRRLPHAAVQLLAGAQVNTQNARGQTALHIAAAEDFDELCRVLLDNSADPNIFDADGNNALHSAVARGACKSTQLLLLESEVDYVATNKKRQNIMHLCANNKGIVSAEVFLTILEVHPDFPLEIPDMYGNTLFLLSFINGNAELCRMALKNGACMGVVNHHGQSVFNIDTPTKQLLFGLLDDLEREPRWAEGEQCSECDAKFTLTMRKHHCRHCGRLVCAKCSEHQMPIVKYNLAKNVRVCALCYDVLIMGADHATNVASSTPAI